MNIKKIYNPQRVYEGWYESYLIQPWFRRYADFRDGESGRDCALSLLAWAIATLGLAGLLMGLVGLLGPEVGFICMTVCGCAWIAYSLIPFAALLARTFNGKDAEPRRPRFLGIDTLLTIVCGLFFIFGLLMMITTLNSENLHPDAGYEEIEETAIQQTDTVVEEPIFTYQDTRPDTTAVVDTMSDLTDPDMVAPDESFDPTIATAPESPTPEEPNDSIYF